MASSNVPTDIDILDQYIDEIIILYFRGYTVFAAIAIIKAIIIEEEKEPFAEGSMSEFGKHS